MSNLPSSSKLKLRSYLKLNFCHQKPYSDENSRHKILNRHFLERIYENLSNETDIDLRVIYLKLSKICCIDLRFKVLI